MGLNEKLKKAREHLGKSQKEMADLVGGGYRSWQGYEQGTNYPGGKVFQSLSDLGFNASWFFSDDVPMLLDEKPMRLSKEPSSPSVPTASLGEHVDLLAKIHNSGNTILIKAIDANLHAFSEAIDNKAMAIKAIDMMEEMNNRMLAMEEELQRLKRENSRLDMEAGEQSLEKKVA